MDVEFMVSDSLEVRTPDTTTPGVMNTLLMVGGETEANPFQNVRGSGICCRRNVQYYTPRRWS